jgi:hypothetical protein
MKNSQCEGGALAAFTHREGTVSISPEMGLGRALGICDHLSDDLITTSLIVGSPYWQKSSKKDRAVSCGCSDQDEAGKNEPEAESAQPRSICKLYKIIFIINCL